MVVTLFLNYLPHKFDDRIDIFSVQSLLQLFPCHQIKAYQLFPSFDKVHINYTLNNLILDPYNIR